jgi:cobaltochelatase CobS
MVMSNDELKGKLYELGTVDIRSVLRILNNTVAKTVEGAQLAAMKHEAAFRVILDEYLNKPARCGPEAVENAYLKVIEAPNAPERKSELPPPPWEEPRPTRVETPSEPRKPKTREEMLAELLAAPSLDVTQVNALIAAHPNVKNFNEFCDAQLNINESVGTSITHIHEQYDSVKADVDVLTSRIEKDRETVAQTRQEMLDIIKKSNAVSLTITFLDDKPAVDLGIVHRDTPRLIKYLAAGCHVFLPGPAGSGKSTAAEQAALALGLNFYATSVCQQTTETKFLGYMDAGGHYHGTQYREAFENGGLFLVDEIDAGNPNVLAVLNASLSNSWCAFPDKMVRRHPKFRCVAAGNTWGTGRTIQYVGRNPIDAATLNRFVYIQWDYDEALETKIAGMPEWSAFVQACRAEIKRRGVNFLISPRASIFGALLLKAGVPVQDVINDVVMPNLDPDIKTYMPPSPVISI